MRVVVVLVGHGSPPKGYPAEKVSEYVRLEKQLASGGEDVKRRFQELDTEIRSYPRTPENDPYWHGLNELVKAMKEKGGDFLDIIPAFNEFCSPTIEEAVSRAANMKPDKIVVVPTMMVRGGEHSEEDIPEKLEELSEKVRGVEIIYAWPFDLAELASFLVGQAKRYAYKQ
ncbi:MAG: CbiX/SirB N-terminal domain-containing protein [Aigarchaeota archaeon]|nr:CbiX/SirB N-terminal domain-containing protein [Candidatus Pelearchaeum maunauluense]